MSCDLAITDCFGKSVRLDHSNWVKHAVRRPEAVPYHDRIATVLTDPDTVVEARRDGHYHFYRRGVGDGAFAHSYLCVVVEYSGESGVIKTWWFCSTIRTKGRERWTRQRGD